MDMEYHIAGSVSYRCVGVGGAVVEEMDGGVHCGLGSLCLDGGKGTNGD